MSVVRDIAPRAFSLMFNLRFFSRYGDSFFCAIYRRWDLYTFTVHGLFNLLEGNLRYYFKGFDIIEVP